MNRQPLLPCALLVLARLASAQISIPGDGSDGVFAPTTNVVVDLSQAISAAWDTNNAANAGTGVYDPDKWAVVFKFQSVSVPTNVTVTFLNHPSRAPVVWLVQSNLQVSGTISLDGEPSDDDLSQTNINKQGGPGGFRGGLGSFARNGLGPSDGPYNRSYGNSQVLPLMGGPGGWGLQGSQQNARRAGGGGAILIATPASIGVDGSITARGGAPGYGQSFGGGIRLIAQEIHGAGTFDVGNGGRLRLEAGAQHLSNPAWADYLPMDPGPTPMIWPSPDAPKASVVSIDGQPVPAQPLAALTGPPDLTITTNQAVNVVVQTLNFPLQGTVSVRVVPKYTDAFWVNASYTSGTFAQAFWTASVTFPSAYSTVIVRATSP